MFWIFCVICAINLCKCETEITILHTNDIHSHFEETIGPEGWKHGGIARRKTQIDAIRDDPTSGNVFLLDSGDQFTGTLWFYEYKGQAESHFMNLLQYDAMALGTHEFDDVHALGEFLDNVDFPVLCANVNVSGEARLRGLVRSSVILQKHDVRVGVIGYITTAVTQRAHPDNTQGVQVHNVLDPIKAEVSKLQAEGVKMIVAMGHAGRDMDERIARLEGIDVVVAGHSGEPPPTERTRGSYPQVVHKHSGEMALIVSAHQFGKYLGVLKVQFDDEGRVLSASGNPIFLNESVVQDEDVLLELGLWQGPVDNLYSQTLGYTEVSLQGSQLCRQFECNIGNLITDALVEYYTLKLSAEPGAWTQTSIALWNSGSIRASIPRGTVSLGNILEVMPFKNTLDRVEITGSTLLKILEHSATDWRLEYPWGGFLQYSGITVLYDRSLQEGGRVVEVRVRCASCAVPQYEMLNMTAHYHVLAPRFLTRGGDGYIMLKHEQLSSTEYRELDSDIMTKHLMTRSPVVVGVEGRIRFVTKPTDTVVNPDPINTGQGAASASQLNVTLLLLILCTLTHLDTEAMCVSVSCDASPL